MFMRPECGICQLLEDKILSNLVEQHGDDLDVGIVDCTLP